VTTKTTETSASDGIGMRHLRVGWWALLVYLLLGLALEGMHGFKVGAYLDVGNETRRLMWRLAHAHGTLLALVNIAYGLTARSVPAATASGSWLASPCLLGALALIPLGFFGGGIVVHGADPGVAVLLVPAGAVALAVGVAAVARAMR
jgi:hypothetical protein